jgi:hypothetical protein
MIASAISPTRPASPSDFTSATVPSNSSTPICHHAKLRKGPPELLRPSAQGEIW